MSYDDDVSHAINVVEGVDAGVMVLAGSAPSAGP